jgi:hypothetical protein
MNTHRNGWTWQWMATVVGVHLILSAAHGAAHTGAQVPLSAAANLFVYIVILAGPLIGLAVSWRFERLGGLIVALTMAGSLIFGVVNHFVLESPDHVSQVATGWRMLFGATAALLSVTELLGLGFAMRLLRERSWS